MATVLFAWELGSGLGHLMQLAPLANNMAMAGHRVYAAVRDVGRAPVAFDPAVRLLPAPFALASARPARLAHTFAHILADIGWSDERQLAARAEAWRNLYRLVRPDLIVFDHSPTAMLASHGAPGRRVVIGNGFTVPADVYPLPNLRVWVKQEPDALGRFAGEEDALQGRANSLLKRWGQKPLQRLGQLYSQVDLTLLATLPELDPHARWRPPGTRYRGAVNPAGGKPPRWPETGGKKVFVYLRGCPVAGDVLRRLRDRGTSCLALVDGLSAAQRMELDHPTLRLETERLDLARIVRECDLGVLNANFATSTAMLLGGKPALHVPMFLEHILTARCVRTIGAGLDAPARQPSTVIERLDALLDSDRFRSGAGTFAHRYRDFDSARVREGMLQRCLELIK